MLYPSPHKKKGKIEIDRDKLNDRYKLVMEGVKKVQWETRDGDEEGNTNAASYVDDYKKNYGKNAKVDAYQTFTLANGDKEKIRFEMSNPKYSKRNDVLTYDLTPKSKKQLAKITGLEGENLGEGALYSTESTRWTPDWMPYGRFMDLRGADLSYANLRGARMSGALLDNANLSHADLRGTHLDDARLKKARLDNANLRDANLIKADLDTANLRHANLFSARLYNARLWNANLSYANLFRVILKNTDLDNANLRFANVNFRGTFNSNFRNADLSGARGLNPKKVEFSRWENTICPDGSINIGTEICIGDQLIPLA